MSITIKSIINFKLSAKFANFGILSVLVVFHHFCLRARKCKANPSCILWICDIKTLTVRFYFVTNAMGMFMLVLLWMCRVVCVCGNYVQCWYVHLSLGLSSIPVHHQPHLTCNITKNRVFDSADFSYLLRNWASFQLSFNLCEPPAVEMSFLRFYSLIHIESCYSWYESCLIKHLLHLYSTGGTREWF